MEDNNKTLMQCLACGYSTSTDFEGTMENEKIKALDEDMKIWSKEAGGFVTDFKGRNEYIVNKTILVTNSKINNEMMEVLK